MSIIKAAARSLKSSAGTAGTARPGQAASSSVRLLRSVADALEARRTVDVL